MGTLLRMSFERRREWTGAFTTVATLIVLAIALAGAPALAAGTTVAAASGESIVRKSFVIDFDGFPARGELTYPAEGNGPFPTVILVHGSGPADMNNSIVDYDVMTGTVVVKSAIFADIATSLSEAGYAVIRYNKRHVVSFDEFDYLSFMMNVDMNTLAQDLLTVVDFAKAESVVDDKAMYLYGWSEGSTVAAHVAATNSELAGLIVQTPVAFDWRATFEYQIHDVGLRYLRSVAGGDPVTAETIMTIMADADAGIVAKSIANYIADEAAFMAGQIAVNSVLDADGDGQLDIDGEVVPGLDVLLDFAFGPMGPLGMYGPDRALPVVTEQADNLAVPVLILQGVEDANVPVEGARLLARALVEAGVDVTLHTYDGLGHSLGPAADALSDGFAPIAQEPLRDVKRWLQAR